MNFYCIRNPHCSLLGKYRVSHSAFASIVVTHRTHLVDFVYTHRSCRYTGSWRMEVMARLLAAGSFSQTVAGSTTKLCFLGFLSDGEIILLFILLLHMLCII
jgi:hypothetical protein